MTSWFYRQLRRAIALCPVFDEHIGEKLETVIKSLYDFGLKYAKEHKCVIKK